MDPFARLVRSHDAGTDRFLEHLHLCQGIHAKQVIDNKFDMNSRRQVQALVNERFNALYVSL